MEDILGTKQCVPVLVDSLVPVTGDVPKGSPASAIEHRDLYPIVRDSLCGERVRKRTEVCVCRTESLCCTAERTTTLHINYTPIKLKKKKKGELTGHFQLVEQRKQSRKASLTRRQILYRVSSGDRGEEPRNMQRRKLFSTARSPSRCTSGRGYGLSEGQRKRPLLQNCTPLKAPRHSCLVLARGPLSLARPVTAS